MINGVGILSYHDYGFVIETVPWWRAWSAQTALIQQCKIIQTHQILRGLIFMFA
jgi:hypothetical protein